MGWHHYHAHLKACGYSIGPSSYGQFPYTLRSVDDHGGTCMRNFRSHTSLARFLRRRALDDLRTFWAMEQDARYSFAVGGSPTLDRCWIENILRASTDNEQRDAEVFWKHRQLAIERYPRLNQAMLADAAPIRRLLNRHWTPGLYQEMLKAFARERSAAELAEALDTNYPANSRNRL